jgi:hypothetical protein
MPLSLQKESDTKFSPLFVDMCETPKGGLATPSTCAPTSSPASTFPETPVGNLLGEGLPLPGMLPFPGLFESEEGLRDFNPFMHLGSFDPASPSNWLNDPAVADIAAAAAAAAAVWAHGAGSSQFDLPFPVDNDIDMSQCSDWAWGDVARPKLRDLRGLPSRGLGLHYNGGQFGVVSLPGSRPPTGPAATVVRSGGADGPVRGLPEVSWTVKDWVAVRTARESGEESWAVTETVPLAKTADASQEEWERRFCQREKQVMVGKGTRGYQEYVKMIPKDQRTARDPATPRVAEQCSKRAFDGRLKQWRILLHAFSPRTSPENSPRTSTRESTDGGEYTESTKGCPPLPKVAFGASAKARVALERAAVPKHLAAELGNVFCGERDGVQNWFGHPQFEFELAKRAHAYLSAEGAQNFVTALPAVSSVLDELRKTNEAESAKMSGH